MNCLRQAQGGRNKVYSWWLAPLNSLLLKVISLQHFFEVLGPYVNTESIFLKETLFLHAMHIKGRNRPLSALLYKFHFAVLLAFAISLTLLFS